MSTAYLMEKINQLTGQLQSDSLELFNNQLVCDDAKETTGNQTVDKQLQARASSSLAAITMLNRRIAVRTALLATLQSEWDEQQKAEAA